MQQELVSCLPVILEKITWQTAAKALISNASLLLSILSDSMPHMLFTSLAQNAMSPVPTELSPSVSETDLQIAKMTRNLLTSICVCQNQSYPTAQKTLLQEVLKLAEAPLLQGGALKSMLGLLKSVPSAGAPGLAHSDLLALLLLGRKGGNDSEREAVGVVNQFMGILHSSQLDNSFSLLDIGETGLITDLGQHLVDLIFDSTYLQVVTLDTMERQEVQLKQCIIEDGLRIADANLGSDWGFVDNGRAINSFFSFCQVGLIMRGLQDENTLEMLHIALEDWRVESKMRRLYSVHQRFSGDISETPTILKQMDRSQCLLLSGDVETNPGPPR